MSYHVIPSLLAIGEHNKKRNGEQAKDKKENIRK